MRRLADIAPDFMAELHAALIAEGYSELVIQLPIVMVGRVSVDQTVSMGYIQIHSPSLSEEQWHKARESVSTICIAQPHWLNIDLDAANRICGIEIEVSGRADLIKQLSY